MVGSLIIVTTRNKAVLDQSEFEVDYKYELNGLDEVHALLLFNRHAFRADHSPKDFDGISRDIISTMGGLPLALEVVGSYLYKKKNKGVWEDVQKKLKNQPHRDVQKILQISYDALEDGHKQIFLDIACFFIDIHDNGKAARLAMYMWEDCGFYPNQGIEELKLRCLIKIGDNGEFMMHDQLRDLGRSIFCQGQPLKKCSGPWDDKYAGVPRVLRHSERHPRFHDFPGAASSGDSKFSEVRWLTWDFPGNTSRGGITEIWKGWKSFNLHLPKLSVLVLWDGNTRGGITENWKGWKSFKASKQLKVLKVQHCANLRCTPELSAFTQLKILQFGGCGRLKHLHPSIGKLTSLVTLDLVFCRNLKKLLEEVGGLKDLEELSLNHSSITAIPSSIGSLRKLKTLSAFMCRSLREIPSSIGDLQNLQNLNLQCTAIEKLPNAIGGLKNLQFLNLTQCSSLKGAIPSEIGDLPSLKTIYLSHSSISKLPESLRNLSSLRSLELSGCKQLWSLPALPSSLRSLYLTGCKELWSLPELPSGLTYLFITCQRLGLPQLLRLTHPETLYLEVRYLLEDIRKLSSITLKLCFEEWDKLTSLSLHGLMHLEELSIKKCSSIKRLDLLGLIHLKRLRIEHCKLTSLSLHGLMHLEELSIKKCSSIKRVVQCGCILMVSLPN
ncbi:disease resistance protein RPV1-like isoform X2 [Eucalyptus grandis]|uniref:disease resistance protein RPV1-like isoform X2 n=1 Tax=Eucalyptus grandis TaxID=71139 RepID=UPI00192EA1C4|nr:disease resistance protein RPV1-like isoform X2 [Eucalyptus grandis]